jgi:predicted outer membrane repeat protein
MFILLVSSVSSGKIIYVDDDANGVNNGTSWQNAFIYLQDAITDARHATKPVEIRVAQGTYKPDLGKNYTLGNREAAFQMINNVSLTGGYAGPVQADPNTRNIELYETILSGDLNSDDAEGINSRILLYEPSRTDNSYRVITCSDIDETTSIDGFTITAGNATGKNYRNGGGMYINFSNLTITNCTFRENTAYSGGGVYNNYYNPNFINCVFLENIAQDYGGGLNINSGAPVLTDCIFNENISGKNGGGMCNSNTNAVLTNCIFNWNVAGSDGGGIYSDGGNPVITNCMFNVNLADSEGGGICNNNSNSILSNCIFTSNVSETYGGGIYNYQSSSTLTNCKFNGNFSAYSGGAICNYSNCSPSLTNCTFSENTTGTFGGGIFNYNKSNPTLKNCSFNGNFAENGGGFSSHSDCNPTLIDCTFIENKAENYGGGMHNYYSCSPKLTNCTFSRNASDVYGGGMYNYNSSNPAIINCTFTKNKAKLYGGGIYTTLNSSPSIEKSIFSENTANNNGGGMYNDNSNTKLTNCILSGNRALSGGGGMFNNKASNIIVGNCTFEGNLSPYGNSICCYSSSDPSIIKLTNCILRDENIQIWNGDSSTITIAYSNIKGFQSASYDVSKKTIWGAGNIDSDPCFADPGYWDTNSTPDNSSDDFWVDGDYHLKSQAGRFDPNTQKWIIDDVTSPCIDAGDPNSPIGVEPIPNGAVINMGAYGGTAQASKSLSNVLLFSEFWPFEKGNRWWNANIVYDGGIDFEITDHFIRNDFDIWHFEYTYGTIRGTMNENYYRVYADGGLYKTSDVNDINSLPNITGKMQLEYPKTIRPNEPIYIPPVSTKNVIAFQGTLEEVLKLSQTNTNLPKEHKLTIDDFPAGNHANVLGFAGFNDSGTYLIGLYGYHFGPMLTSSGMYTMDGTVDEETVVRITKPVDGETINQRMIEAEVIRSSSPVIQMEFLNYKSYLIGTDTDGSDGWSIQMKTLSHGNAMLTARATTANGMIVSSRVINVNVP